MTGLDEKLAITVFDDVSQKLTRIRSLHLNAMMILRIILETCLAAPKLAKNTDLLKLHVAEVIDRLLKGADEIQGTKDDIISSETATKLRRFVLDGNLQEFINIVMMASSGDLAAAGAQTAQATTRCILGCLSRN